MVEPLVLQGLLDGGWRDATFEPFHTGVDIWRLVDGEPAVALLRYAPGASVPRHRHVALETVLVLDGAQSDHRGRYAAGAYVLNPPGFEHAVWSDEGCVALIQWTRPVEFVSDPSGARR